MKSARNEQKRNEREKKKQNCENNVRWKMMDDTCLLGCRRTSVCVCDGMVTMTATSELAQPTKPGGKYHQFLVSEHQPRTGKIIISFCLLRSIDFEWRFDGRTVQRLLTSWGTLPSTLSAIQEWSYSSFRLCHSSHAIIHRYCIINRRRRSHSILCTNFVSIQNSNALNFANKTTQSRQLTNYAINYFIRCSTFHKELTK